MSRMVNATEAKINDVVTFAEMPGDWVIFEKDADAYAIKPFGYVEGAAIIEHRTDRKIIVRIRDRAFFGNEDMITARAMWWS